MTMRTTFMVQTFEIHRKRLRPGARDVTRRERGAQAGGGDRRADAGAAALRIVADDETGELESVTILGTFGEIPEDFAEQVSGG